MTDPKSYNELIDIIKGKGWEEVGKVGVDSGELILIDPCKVLSDDEFKENVAGNTPIKFKNGIIAAGWGGDGNYPVFVKKDKRGLVLEMKVVFARDIKHD